MTLAIIAAFLILFLVVVGSATLGMRFYDQRRKKQSPAAPDQKTGTWRE